MTNPIDTLIRNGECALYHDYRLGHAKDLSGNGNDGTLVNSPTWNRNGLAFDYLGNQAVQVAHDATLNLQTLSAVALVEGGRIKQFSNIPQLFSKYGSGNTGYSLSNRDDNGAIALLITSAGTTVYSLSRNLSGFFAQGISVVDGSVNSPMYFDGLVVDASGSAAPSVVNNTEDLFIGNFFTLNRGFGRTISSFLLFNKALSATEHAQVYGQLMKTRQGVLA